MADLRTKGLVNDITNDIQLIWNEFREPMALTSIQWRYQTRLQRIFGKGTGFTWLLDQLAMHGILKVLVTRTGKRWAMPIGEWDALGPEDKDKLSSWCARAADPRYERSIELREQRTKARQAANKFDTDPKL